MTAEIPLDPELIERFWSKVWIFSKHGCWRWIGWTNSFGHGRFDVGNAKYLATHIALQLDGRPRPNAPNDFALHGDTCESAACVNPRHLRWGTTQENTADRDRLGRRNPAKGERHGQSKLTADKVRYIRRSPLNQYELAAELGVSQVSIGNVRRGKTWAHVT